MKVCTRHATGQRFSAPLHPPRAPARQRGDHPGAQARRHSCVIARSGGLARAPAGHGPAPTLHYAASSDDVDVAAALIDDGADVEAPGGSIGTPLDNAVGYACWHVARLLVMRGARVEKVWHAGALGMLELNERSQAVMRRVGMTHDPGDDFDAPWYEIGHPRGRFVLYRMTTSEWRHAAVKSGR